MTVGFDAATELLEGLEAACADGVLVFGSLPPEGRDLDLLARPPEAQALAGELGRRGYVRGPRGWAPVSDGLPPVELVAAAEWRLPADELSALFAVAQALAGHARLLRPSPPHALLILARKAGGGARLSDRTRQRILAELERDPGAWGRAREHAGAWQVPRGLELLERGLTGDVSERLLREAWLERRVRTLRDPDRWRRVSRRLTRRRPVVVAFSGIDGSGKSSQARLLAAALARAGVQAQVVWGPSRNLLFAMPARFKAPLRHALLRIGRTTPEVAQAWAATPPGADTYHVPLPEQSAPVAHAVAAIVAVVQALALRQVFPRRAPRDAVVIYDRHALDCAVYVRHRWGGGRRLGGQVGLIKALAQRPLAAYLIDVSPEVAWRRKREDPLPSLRERAGLYHELRERFGAASLDGERAPADLHEQVFAQVWSRLD